MKILYFIVCNLLGVFFIAQGFSYLILSKSKNIGNRFEDIVIQKFSENKYFTLLKKQSDYYKKGIYPKDNQNPDLIYKFNYPKDEDPVNIAIECKYRSQWYKNKVKISYSKQLERYKEYQRKNNNVFICLGIGGVKKNLFSYLLNLLLNKETPEEFYLIPINKISNIYLEKDKIKEFEILSIFYDRKKGEFRGRRY